MKKIVLIAAIVLGSSTGLSGLLGAASAQTAGFTIYVDAVSDNTVGNVQTTTSVPPNGSVTIEVEVQNVPSGLNGYNVALRWSPAANLTLTAANITDSTGFGQIIKSAGAGTALVAFTNFDDAYCADPAVGPPSEGALNAVLFKATFTNAGPGLGVVNITIDATLTEVAVCDGQGGTAAPDAADAGAIVVASGAAATPTITAPTGTPAPTRTPCAITCTPEPTSPAGDLDVTPTPSPAGAGTAAPTEQTTPGTFALGGGAQAASATARAGYVGADAPGSDGGSGSGLALIWVVAALAALIAAAAGVTYYRRRRAGA